MTPLKIAVAISLLDFLLIGSIITYLSTKPISTKSNIVSITPTPVSLSPSPTTKLPKTSTTPKSTPKNVAPTKDPRCLVRVRGKIFDLTQFRDIHSGGNIFVCSTDMTTEFNGQHNDAIYKQLQKYAI